jgi:hypothetical protein
VRASRRYGPLVGAIALSVVVGVAGAALLGAFDGDADRDDRRARAVEPPYAVTSVALTDELPRRVARACLKAERVVRVPVRCPSWVPAGPLDSRFGGGAVAAQPPGNTFYLLNFHSPRLNRGKRDPGGDPGIQLGHWVAGGGRTGSLVEEFGSPEITAARSREIDGWDVRVEDYVPYPRGGIHGGHVVASTTHGDHRYLASIHGYDHEDVAIAMLLSMLPQ